MDSAPIRVLIADDHAILREGLRALVNAQPGIEVVGEADNAQATLQRTVELRPDILVLDLSMPGGGAETAERVAQDCPAVKVIALTMHEERGYVSRLLRAGAVGYVLKRTASSELVRAIRTVSEGGSYVDPSLAAALLAEQSTRAGRGVSPEAGGSAANLSNREEEVLRLLALGHSNKEVAATLSISVKTVETHRASGLAKLGVNNRAALVRFALATGWLKEP